MPDALVQFLFWPIVAYVVYRMVIGTINRQVDRRYLAITARLLKGSKIPDRVKYYVSFGYSDYSGKPGFGSLHIDGPVTMNQELIDELTNTVGTVGEYHRVVILGFHRMEGSEGQ